MGLQIYIYIFKCGYSNLKKCFNDNGDLARHFETTTFAMATTKTTIFINNIYINARTDVFFYA